jgi:polysaccharide biosynthesis/export protein
MKNLPILLLLILIIAGSCTSKKKLAYLNNLPEPPEESYFTMEIPDYKIQNRDVLYITLKAMDPDGKITDFLGGGISSMTSTAYMPGTGGGYLWGYNVDKDGNILLPVLGFIHVEGKTLDETRQFLQQEFNKGYKNAVVECKLLSFKFTVIGEVKIPGTYVNYGNYLTILEAIGQAGGIGDYGNREKLLVVRTIEGGTKTFSVNLQDKSILSNEAYFLLPGDVVIVEPESGKLFNLNFPPFAAILATITSLITTTLLMIDYFGN